MRTQITLLFIILSTVIIVTSCGDSKAVKEAKGIKAKNILMTVKLKACMAKAEKDSEVLTELKDTTEEQELIMIDLKKDLKNSEMEIARLKQINPTIFWNVQLKPLISNCEGFKVKANEFTKKFTKKSLFYGNVKEILRKCSRARKIDYLIAKQKFKVARTKYAKTKEEKAYIDQMKALYNKNKTLIKEVKKNNAKRIIQALRKDLIAAYDLEKKYKTDLAKSNFRKSKAYKTRKKDLDKIIEYIKSTTFSIIIKDAFKDPYNMEHQGFLYPVGHGYGFDIKKAAPPYTIRGFNFPELEYVNMTSNFGKNRPDDQFLKIMIEEPSDGAKLEKSKKNRQLLIKFKITGAKDLPYNFYDNNKDDKLGGLHNLSVPVVTTTKTELYIINSKGKVLSKIE